ncbi:KTSC domain-containing protein [Thermoanaerobacterium sp. CMT5567-10]|uniref:KTSC domain-containing protein n=1 Tax=Thermoanaerobacterium sp. CMT5567-10 TaxID=3061989 RepID=UPI0037DD475A
MIFVSSSRICMVGQVNNVMQVRFRDGAIYEYYDVTKPEFKDFMSSSSLGAVLSKLDKAHSYRCIQYYIYY